ncbi:MAG: 2-oxoacid:acceptor oxidoreductase subunit alpha [Bacillota bacterium]|nr:2-oxoacid:acceptor oxidoreductase subunit alpha [Bacillota bacterium]
MAASPRVFAWKIGGDQGEGIDSTGTILATVLARAGYWIYGYKWFSSRIKGGHTHFKVRISDRPVNGASSDTHVLVALTQETIDKNIDELLPGGVVLADEAFRPRLPERTPAGVRLVPIPLSEIAKRAGGALMRNMVALGASAYLLGLDLEPFHEFVRRRWGAKGEPVVEANIKALEEGYAFAREHLPGEPFRLPSPDGRPKLTLTGNQALALGAVAAGCRIMAGYPITPATGIMETLAGILPKFGGAVLQMEDELAAVHVVAGAGYAGARAMTATSGPGISLMQEGIGLLSMTETPSVIVDVQRAGPSTGEPTKVEQSDLLALIHGGHGEGPRIVIVPSSVEECFSDGAEAFNLAERFQCPVIVASDLALGEFLHTAEDLPLEQVRIERGALVEGEELRQVGETGFQRYAFTPTGISPRSLPGQPHGQFLATGSEHNVFGHVNEEPENRRRMMEKRWKKLEAVDFPAFTYEGPERPDALVVGLGYTRGVIDEALEALRAHGASVGHLQVRRLSPFPAAELRRRLEGLPFAFLVEQNATGELRFLLEAHDAIPAGVVVEEVHKADGRPFVPEEIARPVAERLGLQGDLEAWLRAGEQLAPVGEAVR